MRQQLREWIKAQSDLTLAELQLRLWEQCQLEVSLLRLWTVLREMGRRLKTSHFMPPSRDMEAGQFRRAAWREHTRTLAAENLIFLDESGVTTEMTRRWGRIQGGGRLHDAVPGGHWRTRSNSPRLEFSPKNGGGTGDSFNSAERVQLALKERFSDSSERPGPLSRLPYQNDRSIQSRAWQ